LRVHQRRFEIALQQNAKPRSGDNLIEPGQRVQHRASRPFATHGGGDLPVIERVGHAVGGGDSLHTKLAEDVTKLVSPGPGFGAACGGGLVRVAAIAESGGALRIAELDAYLRGP
jgi:hypothetical protein